MTSSTAGHTAFTLGPWTFESDETSSGQMFSVYDGFGQRVTDPHIDEQRARLIAAAPYFLEALALIASEYKDDAMPWARSVARAAIAKATGAA